MFKQLIDTLERTQQLSAEEYLTLIENRESCRAYLTQRAAAVKAHYYGNRIYIRGLIEFSNYCKNNCYYCGIRAGNTALTRYRLSKENILACADMGYALGFRTFVLQGGEDTHYTDDDFCFILQAIKQKYPDCAITLSLGERSTESFQRLREAGADRYLLRHETINTTLYGKWHPPTMQLENRLRCIHDLKSLGFQTGVGFMVGAPYQTAADIAQELCFIHEIQPQMVGIGPFVPHQKTPFKDFPAGSAELTIFLLSLVRLTVPRVLLPSTTALATVDADGRLRGIEAGANVIMPNLSPVDVRGNYTLYDNKASLGMESAQSIEDLKKQMQQIGHVIVTERGDYKNEL